MRENFTLRDVISTHKNDLQESILSRVGKVDSESEGYANEKKQRDLSVKFHWGHNHDFGTFKLDGRMDDRHINILAEFMETYGLPQSLEGKKILDVGVWTGGTSLILAKLGAEVVAIEEVKKYAETVDYLAKAFGLKNLIVKNISLYDVEDQDTYDFVLFAGVLYHVTDPILSLRILFNALKDNGKLFVETHGVNVNSSVSLALVEGPRAVTGGSAEEYDRGGWNYFIPSEKALGVWLDAVGFQDIEVGAIDSAQRIKAVATRHRHVDMLQAGLSRLDIR